VTLVGVVRKLMAKRPEDRFQTPAELVAELERLMVRGRWRPATPFSSLSGGETTVVDSSWRLWRRSIRPRWLAAGIVAVLLCAAAATVLFVPAPRRSDKGRDQSGAASGADRLRRENIPEQERLSWQPRELVQVLGSHQGRHWNAVRCLTVSADGKRAFSGGDDNVVRVWDTATLRELAALPHGCQIVGLGLVRESGGQTLFTSGYDGVIRRWNADTLVRRPGDFQNPQPVTCLSPPDGRHGLLACGSGVLWDTQAGRELKRCSGTMPTHQFWGAAFTPDGKRALVAVAPGQFALLETATGKELWRFHAGLPHAVTRLAVTPDGRHVVSGDGIGTVLLWEIATGRFVRRLAATGREVTAIAVSPDGRRVLMALAAPGGASFELRDLPDGKRLLSLGEQVVNSPTITTAVMTPDSRRALTGDHAGRLRLWDLEKGEELHARPDSASSNECVALSGDGRLALVGQANGRVNLWDVALGKLVHSFRDETAVRAVAFPGDGECFAYGGATGNLRVRDTHSGDLRWWRKAAHDDTIHALVFSHDGKKLYSGGGYPGMVKAPLENGAIRVWEVAKNQPAGVLKGHVGPVYGLALSGDGSQLLSCAGDLRLVGGDHGVRLWDLASGKQVSKFEGHKQNVVSVAFSPDGKRAASVSMDGNVWLWDLRKGPGDAGRLLGEHRVWGRAVAFSGDGQRVYSTSEEGSLIAWSLSGDVVRKWRLPGAVAGLALSKDGKHLATANANGTVYILRLPASPPRRR
jgi:WD40 repeat protein